MFASITALPPALGVQKLEPVEMRQLLDLADLLN
jgi:hypothetical protein